MINFKKKITQAVGIDIGRYSIKVVSLEKKEEERILSSYNVKRIPLDISNPPISQLVKEALEEVDLKPEYVNMSISGIDVIVRFVDFPKMTKEQLENALVFEAEKYIPFDVDEVVLDFLILGDSAESGQMRVLLAAARRESVDTLVGIAQQLGMTINVLDPDTFALFNAFTASNELDSSKASAFLDLGFAQTDILISVGDSPYFMRQIQIGGEDITKAISQKLSVPMEKAEEYKLGIIEEGKEGIIEAIESATKVTLDEIVREIQLSFSYFENNNDKPIAEIYCAGGLTDQSGIIEVLSNKLALPVKKWDPIQGIKPVDTISKEDLDLISSRLAVSLGLALRNLNI